MGVIKQISLDYVKKRQTYRSLLSECMDFKKTGNRNSEIEYPIFTINLFILISKIFNVNPLGSHLQAL